MNIAMALHGGAGASRKLDYREIVAHMTGLLETARDRLREGAEAIDVAVATMAEMERSGLYVAGRGCSPNLAGRYELDASLMDGARDAAGAVAALEGYCSPIEVARLVMERTDHVLLVGDGAAAFAAAQGCAPIPGDGWFTAAGAGESNFAPRARTSTVGCAVLDAAGGLAAATSSAGVFEKMSGRVGDSPIIGAGTWADRRVAVSCTGSGELFLKRTAAAQIGWRVAAGEPIADACATVLADIAAAGGEGGMAAVDRHGNLCLPYRAEGMKRGLLTVDGEIRVAVFDD